MSRFLVICLVTTAGLALVGAAAEAQEAKPADGRRAVLVELFTSQGCDMCPAAEKVLGEFAAANPRVVPVAFHVDYFNDPWKDPYSDKLHSERQAAYNTLYTKPKNPDYGLYYTPMVMVDGLVTVNGRDPDGLRAAVRAAQAKPPLVAIDAALKLANDGRAGDLRVTVSPRSPRVARRELLVAAALRDDLVTTEVRSGENANKSLIARYPSLSTRYQFATLGGKDDVTLTYPFRPDPARKPDRLGVAVFVQDRKTGEVYQSAYVPWLVPGSGPARPAADAKSARRR